MSDPSPAKQSKKSRLLRPLKGMFSRSRSPSHQEAQSVTPDSAIASISTSPANNATSVPQVNPQSSQGAQITETSANKIASISTSPTNSATSGPKVNPQGTEYMKILELSSTPSGPLTWENRMKDWGSTAYEGLKMAIQGIYNLSGSFPPLQTTAGVLLTISKVVDVRGSVLYV